MYKPCIQRCIEPLRLPVLQIHAKKGLRHSSFANIVYDMPCGHSVHRTRKKPSFSILPVMFTGGDFQVKLRSSGGRFLK